MKTTQVMLRFDDETLTYIDAMVARLGSGMNRNVAVNMMVSKCREYDELERLRLENEELQRKCLALVKWREDRKLDMNVSYGEAMECLEKMGFDMTNAKYGKLGREV